MPPTFTRGCAAVVVLLAGCTADLEAVPGDRSDPPEPPPVGPDDPPPPPLPDPYELRLDMSETDGFVTGGAPLWPVHGQVIASEGIDRVEVDGQVVALTPERRFGQSVAVEPGMNLVPVSAYDSKGHAREIQRALISSEFLPEGSVNADAAVVALNDEMLQAITESLRTSISALDIASDVMAAGTVDADDCTITPTSARHGTPQLDVHASPTGTLAATFTLPDAHISFEGECEVLFVDIDFHGTIDTDVVVRTEVSAPRTAECSPGLTNTPPVVELPGFDADVDGDSFIESIVVELFEGMAVDLARDEVQGAVEDLAGDLLQEQLAEAALFDRTEMIDVFGAPVDFQLCLTGLVGEAGTPVLYLGSRVQAAPGATRDGAGAPVRTGEPPAREPGRIFLDTNLVAQILFSAWRSEGLDSPDATTVPFSSLSLFIPALRGRYAPDAPMHVAISTGLPPVLRAASAAGDVSTGDLRMEIGEMVLELRVEDEVLFRIGAYLAVTFDLVPMDGALVPVVVDSETDARAWVLEATIAELPPEALETLVSSQLAASAGTILGGARLALPDFAGTVRPVDVQPDAAGRHLALVLE